MTTEPMPSTSCGRDIARTTHGALLLFVRVTCAMRWPAAPSHCVTRAARTVERQRAVTATVGVGVGDGATDGEVDGLSLAADGDGEAGATVGSALDGLEAAEVLVAGPPRLQAPSTTASAAHR